MRKKIITKPIVKDFINIDEVDIKKNIIVFTFEDGGKGILIQAYYQSGQFKLHSLNKTISTGNGWGLPGCVYSLKEAMNLFNGLAQWYVLDSIEDLAEFILTPIDKL